MAPGDPARRRWVITLGVVAAGVVAAAITVAVVVATGGGAESGPRASGTAGGSTAGATSAASAAASSQARHLLIGSLAEGWDVLSASDAIDEGYASSSTDALFAAPGATSTDGPWLLVDIVAGDIVGGDDSFVTMETAFGVGEGVGGAAGGPQPVTINGIAGERGTTFDGSDSISWSTEDGSSVRVISRGVEPAAALQFATSIRIDGDLAGGTGAIAIDTSSDGDSSSGGDSVEAAGLVLVHSANGIGNMAVAGQGSDFGSGFAPVQVNYGRGDGYLTLTVADVTGTDPLAAGRILIDGAADTTVGDLPAVIGSDVNGNAVLSWVADGQVITLTGTADPEDIRAMAPSVRTATVAEWDELIEISRFGGIDQRTAATATLVAAGDLADRTDWSVVATVGADSTGEQPQLEVCIEHDYGVACDPVAIESSPVLTATTPLDDVIGVFAAADPADAMVLRVTVGDDAPIEIPLAARRSMPLATAAWAGSADDDVFVELIDRTARVVLDLTGDEFGTNDTETSGS